ncbi:MAG: putative membrane protein [halophilic archaeon J07HX5]|nr:MAG: putative membrane protein [halophilic archaeon J07HX5]
MTSGVRRAAAFALVGTVTFVVPWIQSVREPAVATLAAAGPFLLLAAAALTVGPRSRVFELLARPSDRHDGRLYGVASFLLAAAGLAILSVSFGLPAHVFVATVVLLSVGTLGDQLVRTVTAEHTLAAAGFVVAGFVGATGAQLVAGWLAGSAISWQLVVFLAASGSLSAALLREALFRGDDALALVAVALVLWLLAWLPLEITALRITVGIGATVVLGYLSVALKTASLRGMLTGVWLGLLAIVVGDYAWFAVLVTFFGIGGLSSKYRYDTKVRRGIAQENKGVRGSGNVLANSLVALVAVLAAAASPEIPGTQTVYLFAFAGAVSGALADTLSSEVGALYDSPRLITTLEPVEPGTDGAVTWQGELAGIGGAAIIAGIAAVGFEPIGAVGAGVVIAAGFVGITVDSALGATVEGGWLGNEGVNLIATFVAAITGSSLSAAVFNSV